MAQVAGKLRGIYTRWPLLTNIGMYGGLYGLGDLSRQVITRQPEYDWPSASRIATVGGVCMGPFYYFWYRMLDRVLPGASRIIVLKKVAADQFVAGSIGISLYFGGTSFLERKPDMLHDLKTKGPKAWFTGLLYWPAIQAVNFCFLPPHLRTTCVAVALFAWTIVLSYMKSESPAVEGQAPQLTEVV